MTPGELSESTRARFRRQCLLIASVLLLGSTSAPAEANQSAREREVKAALLYQFTKYIRWPARSADPLTLCVLGDDPLGAALDHYEGKKVRGRTVRVVRLKRLGTTSCQVLLISPSEDARLEELLRELGKSATLTVGMTKRFARRGGMIAFRKEKNRISLACNVNATRRARLRISARLLRLMTLVRP